MKPAPASIYTRKIAHPAFIALLLSASALALSPPPALADGPATAPLTCQKIQQNCLARVAKAAAAQAKAQKDGVDRPHLTEADCSASYAQAQATGVWPEHVPYNFAAQCTN